MFSLTYRPHLPRLLLHLEHTHSKDLIPGLPRRLVKAHHRGRRRRAVVMSSDVRPPPLLPSGEVDIPAHPVEVVGRGFVCLGHWI